MRAVMMTSWALFAGMFMLQLGNGVQATLLGIRGGLEGFSPAQMSVVMSAYFIGFLGGSRLTPALIRRVGHVRVFAALASFVSAIMILYPVLTDTISWSILRIAIGFCFSGVYVTAESWLNNSATNETRGMSLGIYMIVQMAGVTLAQYLINFGDPGGFILFIIPSVLVSISFAPILLSITPTPPFQTAKPMSLIELYQASPLGCIGMFLMGGVFAAFFGMSAVYGTAAGLTIAQITIFVSSFYVGGLLFQFPIGWISDRVDRRLLIMASAGGAAMCAFLAVGLANNFAIVVALGVMIGGLSNPLYALLIAYTNDYLDLDDMAAASGGLVFVNGLGAIAGPLVAGVLIEVSGAPGYFLFLGVILSIISVYALWRMRQRPATIDTEEQVSYAAILPSSTAVAVEAAQEYYAENVDEEEQTGTITEAST
ncbi:MAG: MFS transporter [Pseudomonadota bacterium]